MITLIEKRNKCNNFFPILILLIVIQIHIQYNNLVILLALHSQPRYCFLSICFTKLEKERWSFKADYLKEKFPMVHSGDILKSCCATQEPNSIVYDNASAMIFAGSALKFKRCYLQPKTWPICLEKMHQI